MGSKVSLFLCLTPEGLQCYFIIGLLYLKKECNYPLALEYLEKFVKEVKGVPKYEFLLEKANSYLEDIKQKIRLSHIDK